MVPGSRRFVVLPDLQKLENVLHVAVGRKFPCVKMRAAGQPRPKIEKAHYLARAAEEEQATTACRTPCAPTAQRATQRHATSMRGSVAGCLFVQDRLQLCRKRQKEGTQCRNSPPKNNQTKFERTRIASGPKLKLQTPRTAALPCPRHRRRQSGRQVPKSMKDW